jgi:cell wall-associated NlpC family hydrolase
MVVSISSLVLIMPVKAGYLIAAGGGAVLLWAGFKGKKWTSALRDITTGKNPQTDTTAYPIVTSPAAYSTGVAASGANVNAETSSAIANDALQYVGAPYVWGGAPGPHGVGPWDCSSFVNAVVGRDLGMAIPMYKAGNYHGQTHGPATGVWLVWTGAFTIKAQDRIAGDIVVWQTHMGIATSQAEYVSAYDTQKGVTHQAISGGGPFGEVAFTRRLKGVTHG